MDGPHSHSAAGARCAGTNTAGISKRDIVGAVLMKGGYVSLCLTSHLHSLQALQMCLVWCSGAGQQHIMMCC
jgi:hypothetical protein